MGPELLKTDEKCYDCHRALEAGSLLHQIVRKQKPTKHCRVLRIKRFFYCEPCYFYLAHQKSIPSRRGDHYANEHWPHRQFLIAKAAVEQPDGTLLCPVGQHRMFWSVEAAMLADIPPPIIGLRASVQHWNKTVLEGRIPDLWCHEHNHGHGNASRASRERDVQWLKENGMGYLLNGQQKQLWTPPQDPQFALGFSA